jgi:hypothetical protein
MVAVAVAGLLMSLIVGGYRFIRRIEYFVSRARHHENMEFITGLLGPETSDALPTHDDLVGPLEALIVESRRAGDLQRTSQLEGLRANLEANRRELDDLRRGHAYHTSMARRYEYASWHPWLPVEPDPPEPKIGTAADLRE